MHKRHDNGTIYNTISSSFSTVLLYNKCSYLQHGGGDGGFKIK